MVRGPGVATGRSGSIGSVFYIEEDYWPLNTVLYVKDFHGNNPRFIYYLLLHFGLAEYAGGAGVPTLNRNSVHEVPITVPRFLDEQQRIVATLDEAFAGLVTVIANVERNLESARELFDSYLDAVFERRDRSWIESPFEDCLDDVKYTTKIKRRDFLREGKFPIISQEAEFINGYWSQAKDLFKVATPVIIFGDHTKILKYVDFDFVLGADGVKILRPSNDWYPKFFYYALRSLPLGSKGYARHYSLLKSKTVWRPGKMAEQQALALQFDNLSAECGRLASIYEANLRAVAELRQSILNKAFSGELTSPPSQAIKEAAE